MKWEERELGLGWRHDWPDISRTGRGRDSWGIEVGKLACLGSLNREGDDGNELPLMYPLRTARRVQSAMNGRATSRAKISLSDWRPLMTSGLIDKLLETTKVMF